LALNAEKKRNGSRSHRIEDSDVKRARITLAARNPDPTSQKLRAEVARNAVSRANCDLSRATA
jgi:hypothetical protein